MGIRKGFVISSLLFSLGFLDRAEAGFASKLADTHRFRIINGEGTYTGVWGLTGEVGWEF